VIVAALHTVDFSGGLFWPGSSEWCVVKAQWQRGDSRLLHDSSDVDTHVWSQRQMDWNIRQLHATYDHAYTCLNGRFYMALWATTDGIDRTTV